MKTCWTRSISDTKAWLANSAGIQMARHGPCHQGVGKRRATSINHQERTARSSSGTLPVGLLQQIRQQNLGPQLSTPTWTPLASCHQTLRSTTGLCASSTVDQEHGRPWLCHRQRQSFMLSELASEKRFAPGILCRKESLVARSTSRRGLTAHHARAWQQGRGHQILSSSWYRM